MEYLLIIKVNKGYSIKLMIQLAYGPNEANSGSPYHTIIIVNNNCIHTGTWRDVKDLKISAHSYPRKADGLYDMLLDIYNNGYYNAKRKVYFYRIKSSHDMN